MESERSGDQHGSSADARGPHEGGERVCAGPRLDGKPSFVQPDSVGSGRAKNVAAHHPRECTRFGVGSDAEGLRARKGKVKKKSSERRAAELLTLLLEESDSESDGYGTDTLQRIDMLLFGQDTSSDDDDGALARARRESRAQCENEDTR